MPSSNVITFGETTHTMTFAEGLAFIARTRRQLARFDVALPGAVGHRMAPEAEARLRSVIDELECDIFRLIKS